MTKSISFKCSKCEKIHEGIPIINFKAPLHYYSIKESERADRVKFNSDTCVIDKNAFYVKGVLELPIIGLEEKLSFNVWVDVSKENFLLYFKFPESENISFQSPIFGWFACEIDGFEECLNLKSKLLFQYTGLKPSVLLEPTQHPLSRAFYGGMSIEKTIEIIEFYTHVN